MSRPDWVAVWEDAYSGVRNQLRAERALGNRPRVNMRNYSDDQIDQYARREAEKRCQEAINRWNEDKK